MTERSILRMGDSRLLRVAQSVEGASWSTLDELIVDMHETMIAAGGTGLAAPQIGVGFAGGDFRSGPERGDDHAVPLTVLVNPLIEIVDASLEVGMEGCLSVPGMRGMVDRHIHIRYRGLDQDQNVISRDATGFHARVVQHEVDHLDGILYPMRIKDLASFGYNDEMLVRTMSETVPTCA